MTKRIFLVVGIILVIVAGSVLFLLNQSKDSPNSSVGSPPANSEEIDRIPEGESVTVEGTLLCLPHANQGGAQTMECAYGLQDDAGVYYAISDTTSDYSLITGVPMNVRVRGIGVVEAKSSAIYKSTKIIYATSLEQIN